MRVMAKERMFDGLILREEGEIFDHPDVTKVDAADPFVKVGAAEQISRPEIEEKLGNREGVRAKTMPPAIEKSPSERARAKKIKVAEAAQGIAVNVDGKDSGDVI